MENSPQATAAGTAQKIVAMLSDSMVIVRVLAPGATRVEIRGDLTNWLPLELAPAANGWWSARIVTAPGAYQVSIRLDDGDWTVPPGLIAVTDEFGGVVGVLVAP
jgi:1,4-alpha-glucan branching enzyme